MKAFAITKQYESVGWIDAPDPVCGPLDVIATPVALAVCTSDPHQIHAGFPAGLVLGHEAVGRVVEVGSLVKNFKVGDIISTCAVTPDWLTDEVQENNQAHCGGPLRAINWAAYENGTLAEKYRVRQADMNGIILPDDVTYDQALLAADMMTTGFHGVDLARVQYGDIVVACGIGAVGQMVVAGAALRGASIIIGIGHRELTKKMAKDFGANYIIDYKETPNIDEEVLKLTGGRAPDAVIFSGGNQDMYRRCVKMVRPNGYVSNLMGQNFDLLLPQADTFGFCYDKNLNGGLCPGGKARLERMINMIRAGRIDPTPEVTHRFYGFDKIPEAYKCMDEKVDSEGNEVLKTVIYCE